MNRAEYEVIINRIASAEARIDLLEAELAKAKGASLDQMVQAEQERVVKKAEKRAGTF